MSCKYVIGSGPTLANATAAWRERDPQQHLQEVPIEPGAGLAALAAVLDALDLADADAFVAIDAQHLNFHRLSVVDALRERGVAMPPLVAASAQLSAGVVPGENGWIGPGAIVQHGCSIGRNVVLGAGAIVGAGAASGASSWIDDGVVIGRAATVGTHVSLGLGVLIGHGVRIADYCVVDRAGRIDKDMASRTFLHASHAGPIVIVGH